MKENYHPEIEVSDKLGGGLTRQYQQMIGIIQWPLEMRRIDLITEVSFLSPFRISPREEYLKTAHQIFVYSEKTV